MLRTLLTFGFASVLLLTSSTVALASGFDRKGAFREFIKCAFTRKVSVNETIYGVTQTNPDFSTLGAAIGAAGLIDVLDGEGPFTVYAPTNDAFDALPPALLQFLLDNPTDLGSVLTLHVSPGEGPKLDPRRTVRPREIPTAQPDGQTVFYNRSDAGPQVNQSNVSCTGVDATNGTIWVIDSVLIPQYLQ